MKSQIINFKDCCELTLLPKEDVEYVVVHGDWQEPKVLTVLLEVPGITCSVSCAYKATGRAMFNLVTSVIHRAVNTTSKVRVRGVLYTGGISSYAGRIVIEKSSQGSSSQLDDKVLVVGEGIRNHSEPTMQIDANVVSASHAFSEGRVDQSQVYYLQSRGLSVKESEDLIVEAFLSQSEV